MNFQAEPEFLGFYGGATGGGEAAYVAAFGSFCDDRLYLTRRQWHDSGKTSMGAGFLPGFDPKKLDVDLDDAFQPLVFEGIPGGIFSAHPNIIRRGGGYELFTWLHGPGPVVRYVKGVSSDGIRFRILNFDRPCLYHPADQLVKDAGADGLIHRDSSGEIRLSGDGRSPERRRELVSNDATYVRFDGATGSYEMYSVLLIDSALYPERRVAYDNAPGWLRMIHRRTSPDGLEWSPPELVITPQPGDSTDLQFYGLTGCDLPEGRFGLLGHYPVAAQTMELEPCFSRDGRTWTRFGVWKNLRSSLSLQGDPVQILFPGPVRNVDGSLLITASAANCLHNQFGKLPKEQYRTGIAVFQCEKRPKSSV